MRWKCYVLIIGILVFWSLFRISLFGFRIFDRKDGVFGQALVTYLFKKSFPTPHTHKTYTYPQPLSL